jgi:hypothetical protein
MAAEFRKARRSLPRRGVGSRLSCAQVERLVAPVLICYYRLMQVLMMSIIHISRHVSALISHVQGCTEVCLHVTNIILRRSVSCAVS